MHVDVHRTEPSIKLGSFDWWWRVLMHVPYYSSLCGGDFPATLFEFRLVAKAIS